MSNNQDFIGSGAFSAQKRWENLQRMRQEPFDLLVIGGGITGAGIASEAARWGFKVALVEKGDFASGTSSRSSKLVHGGLRYLANLQFGLVFEACHQRYQLLKFAPHLVRPLPFVLPVYRNGPRPLWQIRMALRLYNTAVTFPTVMSPDATHPQSWFRHQIWSPSQALENEPLLNPQELVGAAYYCDYSTDDARLTLTTLLEAHRAGATLANYAEVVNLLRAKNRVVGVQLRDRQRGMELEVRAQVVISAVGAWTDQLLGLGSASLRHWLRPTKGVHLVVRRDRLPSQAAITFNSPRDGRFMFLFPWGSRVLIGTTDTDYEGDPDRVFANREDVAYILEAVEQAFPSAGLNEGDIISSYAGLRPLVQDYRATPTHARSRQYRIHEVAPGLVTIAGGKLTLYRTMAWEAVNQVARILGQPSSRYPAHVLTVPQSSFPDGSSWNGQSFREEGDSPRLAGSGLPGEVRQMLRSTYGPELPAVLKLLDEDRSLAGYLSTDLPVIKAQVVHAVRQEMALTLNDVLGRRTPLLTQATDQGLGAVEAVAELMTAELGWSPEEKAAQIKAYRQEVGQSRRWRERS